MPPVPLYRDHDSDDPRAIEGLRRLGIDVVTTVERRAERDTDEDQLDFATQAGRAIYTANGRDFARLHRDLTRAGRGHAGIIVRSRHCLPVGDQVRGLADICSTLEPSDLANSIIYIEDSLRRSA